MAQSKGKRFPMSTAEIKHSHQWKKNKKQKKKNPEQSRKSTGKKN